MRERLRTAALLLVVIAFLPAGGCDYLETRKIERLLEERGQALAAGNAAAYFTWLAPDYEDPWLTLEAARAKVEARFKGKPLPAVGFVHREILLKGDRAVVIERFTLEDQLRGPGRRYDEVEHLLLTREGERWRCRGGDEVLRLLAGRIEEETLLEQTLLRREAALVNKDLDSYMTLVSPRYRYRGEGPEELKAKVARNFQLYDDLSFRGYDRKLWFFGDTATVEQRFSMQAGQVGTPLSFSGRERFDLERTPEGWKFTRGL